MVLDPLDACIPYHLVIQQEPHGLGNGSEHAVAIRPVPVGLVEDRNWRLRREVVDNGQHVDTELSDAVEGKGKDGDDYIIWLLLRQTHRASTDLLTVNKLGKVVEDICLGHVVVAVSLDTPHPEGGPAMDVVPVTGINTVGLAREDLVWQLLLDDTEESPDLVLGGEGSCQMLICCVNRINSCGINYSLLSDGVDNVKVTLQSLSRHVDSLLGELALDDQVCKPPECCSLIDVVQAGSTPHPERSPSPDVIGVVLRIVGVKVGDIVDIGARDVSKLPSDDGQQPLHPILASICPGQELEDGDML